MSDTFNLEGGGSGSFDIKFTLEQAMKAHRGSRGIDLLFL
jgi:hypothetical protein